jgi:hypothetical protein
MTAPELKALLARRPFIPVRLVMKDGTTHDVLHARTFLITRDWLSLGGLDPDLPPPAVRGITPVPIAEIREAVEIAKSPAAAP